MPNDDDSAATVVDVDAGQLAALGAGCPLGNIYTGAIEQPTRQGLQVLRPSRDE